MSHSGPLDALRARLQVLTAPHNIFPATTWGNPRVMTEVLKKIKRDLESEGAESINSDRVQVSLANFVKTQRVENFTQLKYLCHGLLLPVADNSGCILDSEPLFDRLLEIVSIRKNQAKQFRKCFQGLLGAYFAFDLHTAIEGDGAQVQNWRRLRTFLSDHLPRLLIEAQGRESVPEWLQVLTDHKNLLGETPCLRYSAALVNGDTELLKSACTRLGITATSWIWTDAMMAYLDRVCSSNDREFNAGLPNLLKLVNGRFALRRDVQAGARAHFIRWYSERARVWLSGRVADYQSRMEVAPAGVKVQDLGYRWGSCGKGDWLYFHWKTILLPTRIAEYVVVHEIAHLHEPHHTPAFWLRVERAMPDYAQRRAWLAEHGIDVEGI